MRERRTLLLCVLLASVAAARAAAARAAQIAVDLSALEREPANARPVARLRKLLMARIAEEGFTVVPGDDAPDVVLTLARAEAGVAIRARSQSRTLERDVLDCGIAAAEDQLELVQKATELVRAASGPPSPSRSRRARQGGGTRSSRPGWIS